ncbi:MAG: HAD-IIIA family hydrolase [Oxalobacter sp.]|nr:HAD-IIIA family hydrolase [Oxalobacter sp.]
MRDRNFDLIVFDWDGTLMDSTAAIVDSLRDAASELRLPVPDRKKAAHVIGLGLREAWETVCPGLEDSIYPELVALYRKYYLVNSLKITLFDGVEEMLKELAQNGFQLAVATGKSRAGLNRVLKETGLTACFDGTRTVDESFSKPHPSMLLELSDELQVPTARMLMIGDTSHDLMMAKNAGVASVAVNYGAHSVRELEAMQPLYIADSVASLHDWLVKHA